MRMTPQSARTVIRAMRVSAHEHAQKLMAHRVHFVYVGLRAHILHVVYQRKPFKIHRRAGQILPILRTLCKISPADSVSGKSSNSCTKFTTCSLLFPLWYEINGHVSVPIFHAIFVYVRGLILHMVFGSAKKQVRVSLKIRPVHTGTRVRPWGHTLRETNLREVGEGCRYGTTSRAGLLHTRKY